MYDHTAGKVLIILNEIQIPLTWLILYQKGFLRLLAEAGGIVCGPPLLPGTFLGTFLAPMET